MALQDIGSGGVYLVPQREARSEPDEPYAVAGSQFSVNNSSLPVGPTVHLEPTLYLKNNDTQQGLRREIGLQHKLYDCASGTYPEVWYKFKRFETLSLLNLYHFQHELVNLEKKIIGDSFNKISGVFEDSKDRDLLRTLLNDYYSAIQQFEKISQMKRPAMESRKKTVSILEKLLQEEYYKTAPDALGMLDLTPKALGVEPDSIRVFLTRTFTEGGIRRNQTLFAHRNQNENNGQERTPAGRKGETQLFKGRPYAIHIPAIIDVITRLLVSILARFFLLVPMISMSYINSKKYLLLTASLFVLLFAITLSLASKATNQELMVATATYAAVLVVFVGQTSVN